MVCITCDPFPDNIIPRDRLNPNAVKLLSLYPLPTSPGLVANYRSSPVTKDDSDAFDVRVDHNFSEHDQIFGRYSFADTPRFRPGPFPGFADGGGFVEGDETVRTQGASLSYTHAFSPTLINEVRVGFNREHVLRLQPFGNDTSNIPGQFGKVALTFSILSFPGLHRRGRREASTTMGSIRLYQTE
jgi:hypothetical protein